jgi:hypothetical protein
MRFLDHAQQHTALGRTFSAGEWQQTYALDRKVTGTGLKLFTIFKNFPPLALPCARCSKFLPSYSLYQASTEAFVDHILLGITEALFHQIFLF